MNNKTININKLISNGEVIKKLVFKGEIYNFKQRKDINNQKFKYIPTGKHTVPNYHIYIFKKVYIRNLTNNIITREGKQVMGINFQYRPIDFRIIDNFKKKEIFNIKGTLLILGIGSIELNYSHAWTELAARAYALKVSKMDYDFILIDYDNPYIVDILALLNLPKKKLIISTEHEIISAKKIIYPELINNYIEYFLNGTFVYHRKYIPSWLKLLYDDVSRQVSYLKEDNIFENIYISRKNKNQRAILNEKELIITLEKYDFKTIYFEDYSVYEQIKIIKNSKKIIAIHGAGLVNINFCKKGTSLLELFPFNYQCAFFYMHAIMCDLDYSFYIGKPGKKLWRESPIMENFYVDVEVIQKFIIKNWLF